MKIIVFTDGGSRGNPGKAAIGGKILSDSRELHAFAKYIGIATNNEAEYQAIIFALQWLRAFSEQSDESITSVECQLDSKLVVEQLSKRWKIKEPRMKRLAEDCWSILKELPFSITFHHIPREKNTDADALVNSALDAKK